MKHIGIIAAMVFAGALTACTKSYDVQVTRLLADGEVRSGLPAESFNVVDIHVMVPETLEVVENNYLYPHGDIIWRGERRGDRRAQVKAIFETAMKRGVGELPKRGVPSRLVIEVTRFHALSNSAHRTTGGVHALQFKMVLRDPKTGADLSTTHFVRADMLAYGGKNASIAITAGQTQKVRITDRLADVIKTILSEPEGFSPTDLGLVGEFNQY